MWNLKGAPTKKSVIEMESTWNRRIGGVACELAEGRCLLPPYRNLEFNNFKIIDAYEHNAAEPPNRLQCLEASKCWLLANCL